MPLPLPEYDDLDATGLAALARRGDVSAAELADAALARAEARDLGAFAHLDPAAAVRRRAEAAPPGPFQGVPFAVKDLLHPVAGMPMREGSDALRHHVPTTDATLVQRYRAAGLVLLGKTTTPEFGLMGVTEPEAYGPTRNPWAPDRTPGGSSGGAAAAVAARVLPAADASDGGGSIRIPSGYSGLFGLKPSRGRVPDGPTVGEVWHGANASLPVTRTVRDAAAFLDAVAGPSPGDPVALPRPARPFADAVGEDPGRLRVGFSVRSPLGTDVDPACVEAVEDAAALLAELGHDVEEAAPEVDGRALARSYFMMYFGQVAASVRRAEAIAPGARRRVEPVTRLLAEVGERVSAAEYAASLDGWNVYARAVGRFHKRYDLYLTPTTAVLAPHVGAQAPTATERLLAGAAARARAGRLLLKSGFVEQLIIERLADTPFTQLANLAGLPAMSVPLTQTAPLPGAPRGLPVGVQFVGRPASEAGLLRLAAQLEAARPWADRRPALVG
ncbi:amidase [Rubrivirga sp. S365]|uniref:amidase n=1 Tax=Rubrivirga sp. S365 TaxID=3076080 RepID=UPI0028C804DF|nr:amidase [Rubrivirga sp. S365]MDT7856477.1 amidase [Rubrivirga sp. S365]